MNNPNKCINFTDEGLKTYTAIVSKMEMEEIGKFQNELRMAFEIIWNECGGGVALGKEDVNRIYKEID